MKTRTISVVLASQHVGTRALVEGILEREKGVEIAGETRDTERTLAMARALKPDFLILGADLPSSTGRETAPSPPADSREIARMISEELPATRVMLLDDLEDGAFSGGNATPGYLNDRCLAVGGTCVSLAGWSRAGNTAAANQPVMATLKNVADDVIKGKPETLFDKLVFLGTLGFAAGFFLSLTIFLAPVGIPLGGLGALTAVVGLAGKLVTALRRRARSDNDLPTFGEAV